MLEVAQHLRFAVVRTEHGVRQVGRSTQQPGWNTGRQVLGIQLRHIQAVISAQKHVEQARHRFNATGFVEAHTQLPAPKNPQVDLSRLGAFYNRRLAAAYVQGQGIEELSVDPLQALALQAGGENACQAMNPLGDPLQAFGAVIHRIEAGDIGQQHLGCADV
ncbi:hypothetical protein D9M71_321000 [compost metagenome]